MTTEDKSPPAEGTVLIFDTTLRDGEQSPGVALNVEEKLEIARALERMRVDFIEAAFPAPSPGDLESVTQIAQQVRGTATAAPSRAVHAGVYPCRAHAHPPLQPRNHRFTSASGIAPL